MGHTRRHELSCRKSYDLQASCTCVDRMVVRGDDGRVLFDGTRAEFNDWGLRETMKATLPEHNPAPTGKEQEHE